MGIVAIAWFGAGAFADTEKMMPTLAQEVFPGWLAGLVICGALAAMMSTADSQLLVTSSAFTEDVYHQEIHPDASDEKLVKMGRWATLRVGLLGPFLALASAHWSGRDALYDAEGFAGGGGGVSHQGGHHGHQGPGGDVRGAACQDLQVRHVILNTLKLSCKNVIMSNVVL